MSPATACALGKGPAVCGEKQMPAPAQLSARNKLSGRNVSTAVDNTRAPGRQGGEGHGHFPHGTSVVFPGPASHRSRRRSQSLPVSLRASLSVPLPLLLLLLLLLLPFQMAGLQSTAVVDADTEEENGAKPSGLRAQHHATHSSRRLVGLPGVKTFSGNDGGAAGGEGEGAGGGEASVSKEDSEAGGGVIAGDGGGAGDEPLTPEESAEALLADGRTRCFFGHVKGRSYFRRRPKQRLLCLPTLFFLGVSKCGTTSLSEWMSHHPRIRWVRRPEHLYYLEAHVFDVPSDAAKWRRAATAPSSLLRNRLAVAAHKVDTVIDYTPNYSLVAEAPYRISDVYGEGPLRERGLRFLVLLRDPAARTISSWEYKTDPDLAARVANARYPEALRASLGRTVEVRPLKQAVEEGMMMVTRLSACVANATAAGGGYGVGGHEVTSCDYDSATVLETNCENGGARERNQGLEGEGGGAGGVPRDGGQRLPPEPGRGQGCGNPVCERHVEPWCNPADFLEHNLYDAHVGKGAYALQLARWFAVFGRDKFKVIFTEDMAEDPMGTLEDAFDFLGLDLVDPAGVEGLRNREEWNSIVRNWSNEANPEKKAKLAPQVTPEIVESLRNFFAPHNDALEELLGVPVPAAWRARR